MEIKNKKEVDYNREDNLKYRLIIFLLGAMVFVFVTDFISSWLNKETNSRYRQNLVEDYDVFYSDCSDYFSKNNLIDLTQAAELYREEIAKNIVFEKEIKLYDQEKTNNERVFDVVCEELQRFSRNETKQVICDIDYPPKEQRPQKECDARGCVYY